jgi:hypothetical protein
MSGGVSESFEIKKLSYKERDNFWKILHQGYEKHSIIGCSIGVIFKKFSFAILIKIFKKFQADPSVREARMANGLVRGNKIYVFNS